jgi:undecaprenyl-diphosphatase
MKAEIEKLIKQISLKVLVIMGLFLMALFIFAFLADEAVYEHEDSFDKSVINFLSTHLTNGLIQAMKDFTFFGSSFFLFPAYIIMIVYFIIKKMPRRAIDISIIVISSTGMMFLLKQVFHRKRPELPIIKGITDYSFPSGHALSSFIFCSILAYLIWQGKLRPLLKYLLMTLLFFFTVTIGISRIILNVHYTTDVIAGFCLGVMWVILSFWILNLLSGMAVVSKEQPVLKKD